MDKTGKIKYKTYFSHRNTIKTDKKTNFVK